MFLISLHNIGDAVKPLGELGTLQYCAVCCEIFMTAAILQDLLVEGFFCPHVAFFFCAGITQGFEHLSQMLIVARLRKLSSLKFSPPPLLTV